MIPWPARVARVILEVFGGILAAYCLGRFTFAALVWLGIYPLKP